MGGRKKRSNPLRKLIFTLFEFKRGKYHKSSSLFQQLCFATSFFSFFFTKTDEMTQDRVNMMVTVPVKSIK